MPKSVMIMGTDPLILTGTLRENLDPFKEYFDEDIIYALNEVEFWQDLSKSSDLVAQPNFGRLDFFL